MLLTGLKNTLYIKSKYIYRIEHTQTVIANRVNDNLNGKFDIPEQNATLKIISNLFAELNHSKPSKTFSGLLQTEVNHTPLLLR